MENTWLEELIAIYPISNRPKEFDLDINNSGQYAKFRGDNFVDRRKKVMNYIDPVALTGKLRSYENAPSHQMQILLDASLEIGKSTVALRLGEINEKLKQAGCKEWSRFKLRDNIRFLVEHDEISYTDVRGVYNLNVLRRFNGVVKKLLDDVIIQRSSKPKAESTSSQEEEDIKVAINHFIRSSLRELEKITHEKQNQEENDV